MEKELLHYITDEIIALVPARGGSKTVPKKNIRLFQGHPLIAYSIAAAKLSKSITRVIVSTDSEEIAAFGRQYGAEVPFLRPKEFARDDSPDLEFVRHAIHWLYSNEGKLPRYIVHLRPTTPIRSYEKVDEAIRIMMNDSVATSLRSGACCASPPYKWFKQIQGETYLSPLMPGITIAETNLARQDFPDVFVPNGYVDILKTECVVTTDTMHGNKMLGYWTEEVPDIDTEFDIKMLECYKGLQQALVELQEYCTTITHIDERMV